MTNKELAEEIEAIVKDLCRFGGRQDKYALEVVDEIKKRLERLEILEILSASLLKKPITNGTDSSKMILLDSESYDRIKELLDK